MNKFDYSLYDYSEYETPQMEEKKPSSNKIDYGTEVSELKVSPKKTEISENKFNYDLYDTSEITSTTSERQKTEAEKDKVFQQYAVQEKTPEQIRKMSPQERYDYAQDLARQTEYLSSAGFTKSALSSATLGITENIDVLKPQEYETQKTLGGLVGAAVPITGAAKAVGVPIKYATQNVPKVLKPLVDLMHLTGTGATYESGRQAVNYAFGKEVDLAQIPKTAAEFATVGVLLKGGGKLVEKFLKSSPKHQTQLLEEGIIPADLPKSQYETYEEMLNSVKQIKDKSKFPGFPPDGGLPPPPGAPPAPIRPSRITEPKDIGLRPITKKEKLPIQDEVALIFSPNRFYNTTEGGKAFKNEIRNNDEDVYRAVNELYRTSDELNSKVDEIHPQLVSRVENRINEIIKIPEPSDVQKRLLQASKNILKKISDESGGFKPINNQVLIEQVQALRQIIDYDFAHGNTKNIFRPLINDLEDAAIRAAESRGQGEAADALREAKSGYKTWVEAFDNDYVRPFRDASDQDYSKLFKSALDIDESNILKKVLGISEKGQELYNASISEMVENRLSEFFKKPESYTSREFDKALRELEAVVSPEQAKEIRTLFKNAQAKKPEFKAKVQPAKEPSKAETISEKYEGKKPEDIQRMMNTRSGIKEIREDFSKEYFERASKQKMRSIFREGNIESTATGDDLYKFLNKEKNYELFSEFLGEKEAENLRLAAKEIGKQSIKNASRKKNLSKLMNKVIVHKTLDLIISIL